MQAEFSDETRRLNGAANLGLGLDSTYTRFTGISGTPLRDGYHFGQTIVNDYGRPYGEGFNDVTGFTASGVGWAVLVFRSRRISACSRSVISDPPSVLQAIATEDGVVTALPDGSPTIDRFRLIEGSIGLTVE